MNNHIVIMADAEVSLEKVFVNELLCYVVQHMHWSTRDHLFKTISRFYNLDEIVAAKKALFKMYDTLGDFQQRKTSTNRTEQLAHADDILQGVYDLDSLGIGMKFAAVNLDRVPKWSPNEIEHFALVEKLTAVEGRLSNMELVVSENKMQILHNKDNFSDLKDYVVRNENKIKADPPRSSYSQITRSAESNVQVKDMTHSDNQSIWSIPQNPKVDGDRIKVKQKEKVVSTNKVPYQQDKGSVSKEDSEGFVLPYSQRKRIARKKTHVIKGTGSNGRVKGAPPPIRDFFVYRADTNTTEDDIKWLLDESEIKCVSVLRVS